MTTATAENGREVKMKSGLGNPAKLGKEFSFADIEGLRQVFARLEISNLKRSGKVDYWLNKNHKALDSVWKDYMGEEWKLLKQFAEIFEKDGLEFLVHKGADDTDLVYFHSGAMFKKDGDKMIPTFNPYWKMTIPATEEGKEATTQDMQYRIKYNTDTAEEEFNVELMKLREEYKANIDLWPLKEEHLEGLSVVWKDIKTGGDGKQYLESDATQFRSLLYDNCIIA